MNYDEENRWYMSFWGSYCRACNWYTSKIRQVFSSALGLLEEHGFGKLLENKVNRDELKKGLKILCRCRNLFRLQSGNCRKWQVLYSPVLPQKRV
ncbi:MAG: hypothetical protein ABIK23_02400 [candidate division WOR-3 bacterium]